MTAYSFKKRFVGPIRAGLGLIGAFYDDDMNEVPCDFVIDAGSPKPRPFDPLLDLNPPVHPKWQTIRSVGRRHHAKPGGTIQLYCGMRTKQCFKIGDARCMSVDPIEIRVREHSMLIRVWGHWIKEGRIHDFARADGFSSAEDMHEFWKSEHGVGDFDGLLIRWEPL